MSSSIPCRCLSLCTIFYAEGADIGVSNCASTSSSTKKYPGGKVPLICHKQANLISPFLFHLNSESLLDTIHTLKQIIGNGSYLCC